MRLSSFADRYVSERIKPFFFLSYPVPNSPPAVSPYWSRYYGTGPDDVYLLLGWGVTLVVLRWVFLALFRSFARWWLSGTSSLNHPSEKKGHTLGNGGNHANGVASSVAVNGHAAGNDARLRTSQQPENSRGLATVSQRHRIDRVSRKASAIRERTATRFAEQGAVFVYYTFAWLFGVVCNHVLLSVVNLLGFTVGELIHIRRRLDEHRPLLGTLPSCPAPQPYQGILFPRVCLLYHAISHPEYRRTPKGPLANAEPPFYHRWSHCIQLFYSFNEAWLRHPRATRLV